MTPGSLRSRRTCQQKFIKRKLALKENEENIFSDDEESGP